MRKLIESTLVSLDGVIEAPERWAIFDAEAAAYSLEQLGDYDAFVMGRVTYEKFLANWGHIAGDPYIDRISAMPKYVASRSLTQTAWNATLLGPDPSSAIARLKDQPGKDLIKYGTSRLDDTLVRDHLIDEFRFWIMPVVAEGSPPVPCRDHRLQADTLDAIRRVAFNHDHDVVRLGIQRIPDQLDNGLDRPVAVRKAKDQVVLGVNVEPSHGCSLPHRADGSLDVRGLPSISSNTISGTGFDVEPVTRTGRKMCFQQPPGPGSAPTTVHCGFPRHRELLRCGHHVCH
jgi:dihydrofolate reductase